MPDESAMLQSAMMDNLGRPAGMMGGGMMGPGGPPDEGDGGDPIAAALAMVKQTLEINMELAKLLSSLGQPQAGPMEPPLGP